MTPLRQPLPTHTTQNTRLAVLCGSGWLDASKSARRASRTLQTQGATPQNSRPAAHDILPGQLPRRPQTCIRQPQQLHCPSSVRRARGSLRCSGSLSITRLLPCVRAPSGSRRATPRSAGAASPAQAPLPCLGHVHGCWAFHPYQNCLNIILSFI